MDCYPFSVSNLAFELNCFHLKKLKNSIRFLNRRLEGNLEVNNKDNRVFMSRNSRLIVAPWKFDVLKTSVLALEASLLGQLFVLRTSNFQGATIYQPIVPQQKCSIV